MSPRRGQALVLFSLSMLLVVLMVTLTLSIGVRVRERIEAQTVADAAAYSEAVTVARTFNTVALLNRAQVAHMVAHAGTQSLMSWSAQQYEVISRAKKILGDMKKREDECPQLSKAKEAIQDKLGPIKDGWDSRDEAAAEQARDQQANAIALWEEQTALYQQLNDVLSNKRILKQILAGANGTSPDDTTMFPGKLTSPEDGNAKILETALSKQQGECDAKASLCDGDAQSHHMAAATMGTRGWRFVRRRDSGDVLAEDKLESWLKAAVPGARVRVSGGGGGSGFGDNRHGAQTLAGVASQPYSWAEDDEGNIHIAILCIVGGSGGPASSALLAAGPAGMLPGSPGQTTTTDTEDSVNASANNGQGQSATTTDCGASATSGDTTASVDFGGCGSSSSSSPPTGGAVPPTYGAATAGPGGTTQFWAHGRDKFSRTWVKASDQQNQQDADHFGAPDGDKRRHVLAKFVEGPKAVWPGNVDFHHELANNEGAYYGQPMGYTMVQRKYDPEERTDPWLFNFSYRFGAETSTFNNRGTEVGGYDLTRQIAIAAGITYYHRSGGDDLSRWREPPNLLNPFWRATLVPPATDLAEKLADADYVDEAKVIKALEGADYQFRSQRAPQ
jgi:hypothetical protein